MGIEIALPIVKLSAGAIGKTEKEPEYKQLELFEWKVEDKFLESNNIPTSQVRRKNGLICLNDMWRVAGSVKNKIPSRWIALKHTQFLIKLLRTQVNGDIYQIYRGRNGGTFSVDELAYKYWEYLSVKRQVKLTEKKVQSQLAKSIGTVKREVQTLAGKIDILTAKELIEVKSVNNWKCAVGQVIIYGQSYPDRQKRIHLFGEASPAFLSMIRSHCTVFDIEVTWEY
ncbi:KilA-N domain-containing protein [Kamptonema sp. UHCC 0994]|uniref:KilA-N domain-containing protein n=1 Tax=Kamptonema sp. UHCC 0994 TaxID=3031329 RepID=UPI0023B96AFD|nr:KilA-N domain-containing protein [Kamptonema sp. UHCC 0994]MDF0552844.1 KilA-N domain-containing protein [Kamptonema sp. UHCC 0994]